MGRGASHAPSQSGKIPFPIDRVRCSPGSAPHPLVAVVLLLLLLPLDPDPARLSLPREIPPAMLLMLSGGCGCVR